MSVSNLIRLLALPLLLCSMRLSTHSEFAGKTYTAKVGESCKLMTEGGCMIYTWCVLKFEKDSVDISYRIKASCSPKEVEKRYEQLNDKTHKKYRWILEKDSVKIEHFSDYGILMIRDTKLVGKKKYSTETDLEFIEEVN